MFYKRILQICIYIFTARKRSLGQGNIFSSMCQEFCSQGGSASVHAGIPPSPPPPHPPDQAPLGADPPGPGTVPGPDTPPGPGTTAPQTRHPTPPRSSACWEIRSTSGRYASYWNAILFVQILTGVLNIMKWTMIRTRKHSSRMRTDRAITRPSSERVVIRSLVDKHLWKHYLPLAVGKNIVTWCRSFHNLRVEHVQGVTASRRF